MPTSSAGMRYAFLRCVVFALAVVGAVALLAGDALAVPFALIQQGAKLTAGEESGEGRAGWSVAVSADGNTALIGGPTDGAQVGAAWVFTRSGTNWTQQGPKLTGAGVSAKGAFGISVALSGDGNTAFIGASGDKSDSGSVRVFSRSGSSWTESQKLELMSGAGQQFGASVAVATDGSTAVIGAPGDEEHYGKAFVAKRAGTAWTVTQGIDTCELTEFPSGECIERKQEKVHGEFGASVAVSGDGGTIFVGAPVDEGGSVLIFHKVPEGLGVEYQQLGAKKTPTGAVETPQFGAAVALSSDGNTALIGGPSDHEELGAAWVFTRSGFTWSQQGPKLTATGELSQGDLGTSVALSADGNTALIGAPEESDVEGITEGVGSAWEFTRAGATWSQEGGKITGAGEQSASEGSPYGGEFGSGVALSGDALTALVGGDLDHAGRGALWVFSSATGPVTEPPKAIPPVEMIKGGGPPPIIPAKIAAAKIAAALAAALAPSGKAAKIAALLKHGGFAFKLSALEAGSATVDWLDVPPGAKLARHGKPKPVLVAAGHLSFAAAGTGVIKLKLTGAGKRLLKHAKRVKLTAVGTFAPTGAPTVRAARAFLLTR